MLLFSENYFPRSSWKHPLQLTCSTTQCMVYCTDTFSAWHQTQALSVSLHILTCLFSSTLWKHKHTWRWADSHISTLLISHTWYSSSISSQHTAKRAVIHHWLTAPVWPLSEALVGRTDFAFHTHVAASNIWENRWREWLMGGKMKMVEWWDGEREENKITQKSE